MTRLSIAYAGTSRPGALALRTYAPSDVTLLRSTGQRTDVNWGRAVANSKLNPVTYTATNKKLMRELFAQHNVPAPRLLSFTEALEYVQRGGTVVGRPSYHTRGQNFWKCSTRRQVLEAMRGTRQRRAASHFMELVPFEREYRAHIIAGKCYRISEKGFEDWHSYTTFRPDRRVGRVRQAAKDAVAALGLDFGAVDVMASEDNNEQVWVSEVNTAPGIGGSTSRIYINAFKQWKEEHDE